MGVINGYVTAGQQLGAPGPGVPMVGYLGAEDNSGGMGGGGPGGGGGTDPGTDPPTVTVSCCPTNPLPLTLYATFDVNAFSNCFDCLDNVVTALIWNGSMWYGSFNTANMDGQIPPIADCNAIPQTTVELWLFCDPADNLWKLRWRPMCNPGADTTSVAAGFTCAGPFSIAFDFITDDDICCGTGSGGRVDVDISP